MTDSCVRSCHCSAVRRGGPCLRGISGRAPCALLQARMRGTGGRGPGLSGGTGQLVPHSFCSLWAPSWSEAARRSGAGCAPVAVVAAEPCSGLEAGRRAGRRQRLCRAKPARQSDRTGTKFIPYIGGSMYAPSGERPAETQSHSWQKGQPGQPSKSGGRVRLEGGG